MCKPISTLTGLKQAYCINCESVGHLEFQADLACSVDSKLSFLIYLGSTAESMACWLTTGWGNGSP